VEFAKAFCIRSGLTEAAQKITTSLFYLQGKSPMNISAVGNELRNIQESVMKEASKHQFLKIALDRTGLVDNRDLFGLEVTLAFPSAQADITQAGNCLAAECTTAAVFHLMRAAEIALRALAKDRSVAYPQSSVDEQQCGTLITSLDSKLSALRSADKKLWPSESLKNEQIRFYHAATIELRSFNEAWRKHVCHAGGDSFYDRHQAMSVFEHVRTFMQTLAPRISESGGTPEHWTS
jgi:hypothetical protein